VHVPTVVRGQRAHIRQIQFPQVAHIIHSVGIRRKPLQVCEESTRPVAEASLQSCLWNSSSSMQRPQVSVAKQMITLARDRNIISSFSEVRPPLPLSTLPPPPPTFRREQF